MQLCEAQPCQIIMEKNQLKYWDIVMRFMLGKGDTVDNKKSSFNTSQFT